MINNEYNVILSNLDMRNYKYIVTISNLDTRYNEFNVIFSNLDMINYKYIQNNEYFLAWICEITNTML